MNFKKITIKVLPLLIFLFAFSVQTIAQEKLITIQKKNILVKDVFSAIEKGNVMGALFDICYKIHF